MTVTYRYGLQQRPEPLQFVRDFSLVDPPSALVTANDAGMRAVLDQALQYQWADRGVLIEPPIHPDLPLTGVVVFYTRYDGVAFTYPVQMGVTLSQESLDKLCVLFDQRVVKTLAEVPAPPPPRHKPKK